MAVVTQHAGKDVWDKLHKDAEETLQSRKWNGMTNVPLSQHMSKHRQAYVSARSSKLPVGERCVPIGELSS